MQGIKPSLGKIFVKTRVTKLHAKENYDNVYFKISSTEEVLIAWGFR